MYKLIRLARFYDIYKTCFNQIFAPAYLFSDTNVRVTVLQLEYILANVTLNKITRELIKSVNNWCWLHMYMSVAQSVTQKLCNNIVIAMIFGSQLVLNVDISDSGGYIDALFLIFILKKSKFYQCISQSLT